MVQARSWGAVCFWEHLTPLHTALRQLLEGRRKEKGRREGNTRGRAHARTSSCSSPKPTLAVIVASICALQVHPSGRLNVRRCCSGEEGSL
jgi:hypothetical protein